MPDYPLRRGQCALLIYDMTKELVDPASPGYSAWVMELMPAFQRLIQACHHASVPIFYALPQVRVDETHADRPGEAICGPIRPAPGDTVIVQELRIHPQGGNSPGASGGAGAGGGPGSDRGRDH